MGKAYKPHDGYAWNPLLNCPPNRKCFCASGLKFKKCCRHTLTETIEIKEADKIKAVIAKHGWNFHFKRDAGKPSGEAQGSQDPEIAGSNPAPAIT